MRLNKLFKSILSLVLAASMILSLGIVPSKTVTAETGTVYYIDSVSGNDNNDGKSEASPWKNVSKINTATILPGDQILLKAGSSWNNQRLNIKFSGNADNQIVIGKYGEGAKPIINGGGGNHTIYLENRQYITIQDLEITNYNLTEPDDYKASYYRRSGIQIVAHHDGPKNNIQLRNLDIHNVTGMSIGNGNWIKDTDGSYGNKDSNAAILVNTWEWNTVAENMHAYYNDLLIEGCYIHDTQTMGININGYQAVGDTHLYHKNLIVRNNTIVRTGADSIEIGAAENPLISHNISLDAGSTADDFQWIAGIWVWKTFGATIQYNEVGRVHYVTSGTADSAAFDTDIATRGDHIYQYNYTHDNAGGFFMNMGQLTNGKNILRYNISQNDANYGNTGNTLALNDENLFYNNVFYNDTTDGITMSNSTRTTFTNNVFYTPLGNKPYPSLPKFYCNSFYGSTPPAQGIYNITSDPKFIDPGTGGDGIDTLEGYKLNSDSPLIGAGKVIEDNGGSDFYGNGLYAGAPDIGVYEYPDSEIDDTTHPMKAIDLVCIDKKDTTITLAWNAMENNMPLDADIYDASTNTLLGTAVLSNTYTVTNLNPETEYTFYIIVKDLVGNMSIASDSITVSTSFDTVIVDNTDAVKVGLWNVFTDTASLFYGTDYITTPSGDGSTSITWNPELPREGYYEVYYHLPKGKATRANDVKFTVSFDGGTKQYSVNQRNIVGGDWSKLGMHKFQEGSSGYVALDNNAVTGEVAADAVKFRYVEGFGLDSITDVSLQSNKTQLRLNETAQLTFVGTSSNGYSLDLSTDGILIQYSTDNGAIASISAKGEVLGISSGTCVITASTTINGVIFTDSLNIIVGPGFDVSVPSYTDENGSPLNGFTANSTAIAEITVVNSTDKKQTVCLIIGVFNQYGLSNSSFKEVIINAYDQATISTTVKLPADVQNCYLKVNVWDSTSSLKPLAPETILAY